VRGKRDGEEQRREKESVSGRKEEGKESVAVTW
jgi:hypothetical protein